MDKRYVARWVTPEEAARCNEHNGAIDDTLRAKEARRILFVSPLAFAQRIAACLNFMDHLDEDAAQDFIATFGNKP